jgi:predicted nucleic acid-binding protein
LIYPQAKLFQMVEGDGHLHRHEPQRPLSRFGTGEAHAIALAIEKSWVLLINDNRPLIFARLLGINCVSVPAFCALLYEKGQITYPAIEGYLKRLATTTSPVLRTEAESVVRHIASQRGEQR